MEKKHWVCLAIGVLVGMVVGPKLRTLPVLDKVPTVG